jgi:hypothetical protein
MRGTNENTESQIFAQWSRGITLKTYVKDASKTLFTISSRKMDPRQENPSEVEPSD